MYTMTIIFLCFPRTKDTITNVSINDTRIILSEENIKIHQTFSQKKGDSSEDW